ncbi:pilus assembly protein TadG-related protein [Flexivirga alba]|uniref:Pilus assembly protein TadG-related protein n=1 Tax=Flexivirga alba TaxID=702742 RepID=A0ABW2AM84_9MICO
MSSTTRRIRRKVDDDSGQVATGLIICSVLALIAVTFWVMLPIGSAVNQKSGTQNAADAAALAGADNVIDHVVDDIATLPVGPFEPHTFFCGLGATDARTLAQNNGAHLTSYCYDWQSDEATVQVASNQALSGGQHSKAKAVAKTGVPWGDCHFTGLPEPTLTPTPSPSSSSTSPAPSPTSSTPSEPVQLVCGGTTIDYDLQDGHLVVHDLQALRNMLKARLVD